MADHANLLMTEDYQLLLEQRINGRLWDGLVFLDGVSPTNLPVGAKRWNATNKRFESWNGSSWVAMVDKYLIDVDTVDGYHAGSGAGQLMALDGSALVPMAKIPTNLTGKIAEDSNKLGGVLPSTSATATTIAERDAAGKLNAAGFIDTRAAASGFTRVAPGFCKIDNAPSASGPYSTTGTITVNHGITNARAVEIEIQLTTIAANSVDNRYITINVYSDLGLTKAQAQCTLYSREFVASGLPIVLGATNVIRTIQLESLGAAFYMYLQNTTGSRMSYRILGYWD